MRIAMELSDEDVLVLRAVEEAWDHYQHLPAHAMHVVTMPEVKGIPGGSVLGICGKLQSLGLIVNPEVRAKALREGSYPTGGGFVPLERAEVFLRAIAGHDSAPISRCAVTPEHVQGWWWISMSCSYVWLFRAIRTAA